MTLYCPNCAAKEAEQGKALPCDLRPCGHWVLSLLSFCPTCRAEQDRDTAQAALAEQYARAEHWRRRAEAMLVQARALRGAGRIVAVEAAGNKTVAMGAIRDAVQNEKASAAWALRAVEEACRADRNGQDADDSSRSWVSSLRRIAEEFEARQKAEQERDAAQAAARLSVVLNEACDWAAATFTLQTVQSKAHHLVREAAELANNPTDPDEIADCLILLAGICHVAGIDPARAVEGKLAILRQRKWGQPDEQGVVEHVREGEA